MKWITATVGAALVFFGAAMVLLFVPALLFPWLFESIAGVIFAYAIAVPLGVFAAYHSFRATLASHAKSTADLDAAVHVDELEEV